MASVVINLLFIIAPIVCVGFVLSPCSVRQYFVSFLKALSHYEVKHQRIPTHAKISQYVSVR